MKMLIVWFALFCMVPVFAAAPEVAEFASGDVLTYSTKGHPKAHGLSITFKRPKGWTHKEGDRPHIVQKFARPGGLETLTFTILEQTPEKIAEMLTEQAMRKLPESMTYISGKETKIDGLPGFVLNMSMQAQTAGQTVHARMITFSFGYKSFLCHLTGSVGGLTDVGLEERMAELMPLFTLIANSIVVENKWQ